MGKLPQKLVVYRLAGYDGTYEFEFYREGNQYYCRIPGDGGHSARYGPHQADYPEQEAWMRRQPGMKEVWCCHFRAESFEALEALMKRLS